MIQKVTKHDHAVKVTVTYKGNAQRDKACHGVICEWQMSCLLDKNNINICTFIKNELICYQWVFKVFVSVQYNELALQYIIILISTYDGLGQSISNYL